MRFWHEAVLKSEFLIRNQKLLIGPQTDQSWFVSLIGQLTDPGANRKLASFMDRSADRSSGEQWVQKLTDRSADRSGSHWIGLPTDQ